MGRDRASVLLREIARVHVQLQRDEVCGCCATTETQCAILMVLGRVGQVTLTELGRQLGIDKGWTSRAVDVMAQEDLVAKTSDEHDRRTVLISMTPEGEKRWRSLNEALDELVERILRRVPSGERQGIERVLLLLRDALRAETADRTRGGCIQGIKEGPK